MDSETLSTTFAPVKQCKECDELEFEESSLEDKDGNFFCSLNCKLKYYRRIEDLSDKHNTWR